MYGCFVGQRGFHIKRCGVISLYIFLVKFLSGPVIGGSMIGRERYFLVAMVLAGMMFSIIFAGSLQGQSSIFDPSDLMISTFSASPHEDGGFEIELDIENIGPGRSDPTDVIFWDEDDLVSGSRKMIGRVSIPEIKEGSSYALSVRFDPSPVPIHRIWALVDPDSNMEEVQRSNNVASLLIQMPRITGFGSDLVGIENDIFIGTYYEGIPVDIPVTVETEGVLDPSFLRIFLEVNGSDPIFVPLRSSGEFSTVLSTDGLVRGLNVISINSTYAGIPLARKNQSIFLEGIPEYLEGLSGVLTGFDEEMAGYVMSGYLDVKDLNVDIRIKDMEESGKMSIFKGSTDLLLTSIIPIDGRKIVEIDGNMLIETDGDDIPIHLTGNSWIDDESKALDISIEGSRIVTDFEPFPIPISTGIPVDDGREFLTRFSPSASGYIQYTLKIMGVEDSADLVVESEIDINLSGDKEMITRGEGIGFDDPVCEVDHSFRLGFTSILDEGVWSSDSSVSISSRGRLIDTGLVITDGDEDWIIPETGQGVDIIEGPDGEFALISIERGSGSNTAVNLFHNGSRIQVRSDNRYKSSPGVAFMEGGEPVVVWSNAMDWSEDPVSRMASMRLLYSVGTAEGTFSGNGTSPFISNSTDFHPSISSGPGGNIALAWTADMDNDPTTTWDTEIMFSTFDGSVWSSPTGLTSNEISDDNADIAFDSNGDLWATWISGEGIGKIRKLDHQSGNWGLTDSIENEVYGRTVRSVSISDSGKGYPIIALITDEADGRMSIRTWLGDGTSDELGRDERTEMISDGVLSDLSMTSSGLDGVMITFREISGDGEITWILSGEAGSNNVTWKSPLPLYHDGVPRWDLITYPYDRGNVIVSYLHGEEASNSSGISARDLEFVDLSNGARITDIRTELLGEYSRWENVRISVDVTNIGLDPTGSIYVNLERVSRDPITGNVSSVSVKSTLVIFDEGDPRKTIEFTTTLVEHQLRYTVWTGSGWGDPPAYMSSRTINMPVTSDPKVVHVQFSTPSTEDLSTEASVLIRNDGYVTEDPMMVSITGTCGIPVDCDTESDEAPSLILNSTIESLSPGSERMIHMNASLGYGRNLLWIELQMADGMKVLEGPFIITIAAELEIDIREEEIIGIVGDNITCDLTLHNHGFDGEGNTNVTIFMVVIDPRSENVIDSLTIESPIPDGDNFTLIDVMLNLSEQPSGRYVIRAWIGNSTSPDLTIFEETVHERWINLIDPVKASIKGMSVGDLGYLGKEFILEISNDSNRTMNIARISLYNGFPRDGVLISESFLTSVEPGGTASIHLPFDLEVGLYYLTFTISAAQVDASSIEWNDHVLDEISFEHRVNEEPEEGDDSNKLDMDEVNDSVMVGLSAIIAVLAFSLIFKRKDEEDGEEEDEK